jgi:hypothetical protein
MPSPLQILSASEAVQTRKTNRHSTWGDRGSSNRVEPIAKPGFDVPFRLEPGQKIFTVGSCFARNVEAELMRRGFQIPLRDFFRRPEAAGLDFSTVNNFGTPSIYNEFAWAFGDEPFVEDDHILEVTPGKFADIHLTPSRRPEPRELVVNRRTALREVHRLAAACDVTIMTLGLAENWYDTKTGFYLNIAPRPSMIVAEPDRFQLHVLSYEDAYDYLRKALAILHREAPKMQVILTVSPVPLMSTHRAMDVLVANSYSKSVLRAVAEEAVVRHDFVSYFPSYESFVLSDRKLAWIDDLVHTNDDLVAFNVNRMVNAFTSGQASDDRTVVEQAAVLAEVEPDKALSLLEGNNDLAAINIRARALIALGRAREAYDLIEKRCDAKMRSYSTWRGFMNAALATEDVALAESAIRRTKSLYVHATLDQVQMLSSWFHSRGRQDLADELFPTTVAG